MASQSGLHTERCRNRNALKLALSGLQKGFAWSRPYSSTSWRAHSTAYCFGLRHRDSAALRAISALSPAVRDSALAGPPTKPPARFGLCGWRFCEDMSSADSPVAISTISLASWFGSRGRFGMSSVCDAVRRGAIPGFKLRHYPESQSSSHALFPETAGILRCCRVPSPRQYCWLWKRQLAATAQKDHKPLHVEKHS